MSAKFLRHEGFLGAVGAFLKVHPMTPPNQPPTGAREPRKVSHAPYWDLKSPGAPFQRDFQGKPG
jgi:hypothetical protein